TGVVFRPAAAEPVPGVTGAVEIAVGADHACARNRDGNVVCWGANGYGQLGDGTNRDRTEARPVAGAGDVARIFSGYGYTCAIRRGGDVACWGRLYEGVRPVRSSVPVRVQGLDDVVDVGIGPEHACAVRRDGTVRCWGVSLMSDILDNLS